MPSDAQRAFDQSHSNDIVEDVVRIASAPAPAAFFTRYGLAAHSSSSRSALLIANGWDNVRRAFSTYSSKLGSRWASRFSTGAWPVLYTAENVTTAVAEKGYWLQKSFFSKVSSPSHTPCIEIHLRVEGSTRSFLHLLYDFCHLVDPVDYKFCHDLASLAVDAHLDCVMVPSARRLSGKNLPIFKLQAVRDVRQVNSSRFELRNGEIFYETRGYSEQLRIDEVYKSVKFS